MDQGLVRFEDRLGNAEADTAADLGRRHQPEAVMDARRALLNAREVWYPVIPQQHRPRSPCLGSSQGVGKSSPRLISGLMLILLRFLARLGSCTGPGYRFMVGVSLVLLLLPGPMVSACCVNVLVFAGSLHWPSGAEDSGILVCLTLRGSHSL